MYLYFYNITSPSTYHFDIFTFSREEVEEMAKKLKVKLFRASVKEDFNIEECEYCNLSSEQ